MTWRRRTLAAAAAAAAAFALVPPPARAVLCVGKKGGVFSRAGCRKRETPLPVQRIGAAGAPGEKGDPGPVGDPSALRVVDALGQEVGQVFEPVTSLGESVVIIVRMATGPVLFFVTPQGFSETGVERFFESNDCTGDALLETFDSFFPIAQVSAGTAYYPQGVPGDRTVQSIRGDSGTCNTLTTPAVIGPLGAAATVPVSALGFLPPFQMPLP